MSLQQPVFKGLKIPLRNGEWVPYVSDYAGPLAKAALRALKAFKSLQLSIKEGIFGKEVVIDGIVFTATILIGNAAVLDRAMPEGKRDKFQFCWDSITMVHASIDRQCVIRTIRTQTDAWREHKVKTKTYANEDPFDPDFGPYAGE